MKNKLVGIILLLLLSITASPSIAQQPYTPERGTAERKAILDALRPSIEAILRPPVEFVVDTMNVKNGWAFVSVAFQRPGGRKIEPSETGLVNDLFWDAELFDGMGTVALLWFRNGRWNLVDKWGIGATDSPIGYWDKIYSAPREIFWAQ